MKLVAADMAIKDYNEAHGTNYTLVAYDSKGDSTEAVNAYNKLVDDAIETISKYGDFEMFVSDDTYISEQPKPNMPDFMNIPVDSPEEVPFE